MVGTTVARGAGGGSHAPRPADLSIHPEGARRHNACRRKAIDSMRAATTQRFGRLVLAALPLLLAASVGCLPCGWLPDSIGFIYTDDRDFCRLVHYDLASGERRVLVARMPAHTPWPAVSPDGRHIAVARLTRHPDQQKPDTMQVILYDLKGKEARRSS